jgi:hypothetical protein
MRDEEPGGDPVELDLADLRQPVTDQVAPPSMPGPDVLPFQERSWQDFERIVLVMAEHVDGMRGVRAYGVLGQEQHGIDLYGSDGGGANVGYQAKRRVSFDSGDLRAAVEKFAAGVRPVSATKLIICVACDTERTEVSETLEQLREAQDFGIELYDRRRLSENLKTRPDLVRRLFGPEWAAAFCEGVDWPTPERTPADVLAEALVRGPVTALGLEAQLNRCDELAATDPAAAAAELAPVVRALEEKGFGGFAERLRLQHAELLISAGDLAAAVEVLTRLAWEQIESGGAHWDRQALGRLRALIKEADLPDADAFVALADAIGDWYAQPARDLRHLVALCKTLSSTAHSCADAAVLWVLETSIATRDDVSATELANDVDGIVNRRARLGQADQVTVRLRTAKADVDGNWDAILRDARAGRVGSVMATLVHTRRGRERARHDAPEDADAEYAQAIQRACLAGLTAEAAAALRSIIRLRSTFGPLSEDINALSQLAMNVEASGSVGLFPGRDPQDAGASALAREDLPSALRWLKTALRSAVIRGDLNAEHAAEVALADVLTRADERRAALAHALAAGSTKDVEKCFPLNDYVDIRHRMKGGPHWERATALRVASLQADVTPDDHAADCIDLALAGTQEPRRSFFAPHVDLNAWKVLAALGERTTVSQAIAALDQLDGHIEREPNTYRFEDDEHVEVVVGIARAHPSLEDRAVRHLARIIEQGDHFGDTARLAMLRRLNPAPTALTNRLATLADAGNGMALQTLGDLGVAHPDLVSSIQTAVDAILRAPDPPPGVFEFGTALPRVAGRARILGGSERRRVADHCMRLALNDARPESNRTEGVEGLLRLARHLDDDARKEYFPKVVDLVRSAGRTAEVDQQFLGGLHPLSTMRFDLAFGSLPRKALEAAAALALTRADAAEVVALAMEGLMRTEKDAYAAARAISFLSPEDVDIDVGMFVKHPAVWVRQLAAALAVHKDPAADDVITQLAGDSDPSVRRTLATGLGVLETHDRGLADQVTETLLNDSHWSVRQLAGERRSQ